MYKVRVLCPTKSFRVQKRSSQLVRWQFGCLMTHLFYPITSNKALPVLADKQTTRVDVCWTAIVPLFRSYPKAISLPLSCTLIFVALAELTILLQYSDACYAMYVLVAEGIAEAFARVVEIRLMMFRLINVFGCNIWCF